MILCRVSHQWQGVISTYGAYVSCPNPISSAVLINEKKTVVHMSHRHPPFRIQYPNILPRTGPAIGPSAYKLIGVPLSESAQILS